MPPRKNKKIIDDAIVNQVNTFVEKANAKQEEDSSEDEVEIYVEKKTKKKVHPTGSREEVVEPIPQTVLHPAGSRESSEPIAIPKKTRVKRSSDNTDFQLLYKSQKEELDLLRTIHMASLTGGKSLREPVNVCNVPTIIPPVGLERERVKNEVDVRREMFQLKFG
jgi:hypothetical protein